MLIFCINLTVNMTSSSFNIFQNIFKMIGKCSWSGFHAIHKRNPVEEMLLINLRSFATKYN